MKRKRKVIISFIFYAFNNIYKSIITNMEEIIIILMIAQIQTLNNIKSIININIDIAI